MKSVVRTASLLFLFSLFTVAQEPLSPATAALPPQAAVIDPNAATREQVLDLLDAMQIKKLMGDMFDKTMPAMMHNMNQQQMQGMSMGMNEKQKTLFVDGMSRIEAGMLKDFNLDDFIVIYVPIYQKHFSKSDIAPITAFYRSAAGQKMINEQGPIAQEGSQIIGQYMNQKMSAIQAKMTPQITELMKQVDAAADKKPAATAPKLKTGATTKSPTTATKKPATTTKQPDKQQ